MNRDSGRSQNNLNKTHGAESLALGYRLDDRDYRVRFPEGAGNFSLHHSVQTGSGTHLDSYPMGTGDLSSGVKWPEHEADHLPASSVDLYLYSPIRLHGMVLN